MAVPVPARTWGGRTAAERSAERRGRLIDAALALWAESGWAAVTMRQVCTRTGLNDRYFYEHFADRDELLGAAWDDVCAEVFAHLASAVTAERPPLEILREAVRRAVRFQVDDHSRARILLADHAGSAVLEQRRKRMIGDATDLMIELSRPYLRPGVDETDFRISTLIGIGGFVELLTAWRTGTIEIDADRIAEHIHQVGAVLGARFLPLP
ncbi:TetR/AcrR family transcriptional regulator [Nocardia jiangsuensis]|uniref:TetR/AcrR family transcriptional regulator n=1 Tax=Nocardia jiangsuensis TaxID=1691563 RepID=A0ABV8DYF2_9NOCA